MNHTTQQVNLHSLIAKDSLRLGIISDTHHELNQEVVSALHGCDAIVHAGDIGDAQVLTNLKQFTPHVFSVRGNNDIEYKWAPQEHAVLADIPDIFELQFQQQTIGLIHGHQYEPARLRHERLRKHFSHADIVIYGHSHRLVCDQTSKPWVINPGAGGYTRTFGGASCIVAEFDQGDWSFELCQLTPDVDANTG